MTGIHTSAPGKIVLCGEYVVLDGVRAIGAAVNRRAEVLVSASNTDCHVVRCPGYAEGHYPSCAVDSLFVPDQAIPRRILHGFIGLIIVADVRIVVCIQGNRCAVAHIPCAVDCLFVPDRAVEGRIF